MRLTIHSKPYEFRSAFQHATEDVPDIPLLDRVPVNDGNTHSGIASPFFRELHERGVAFVSIREGLDLGTAAGRLQLHILSALGEF
jgi:DNA invertase Pin-like site-specific DNA recombinase